MLASADERKMLAKLAQDLGVSEAQWVRSQIREAYALKYGANKKR